MKPDDPVSQGAAGAIQHLNEDHADALLDMARALGGCPRATAARCVDADRTGLDLTVQTPAGEEEVRVPYDEAIEEPSGLRKATVTLAHRSREILGAETAQPPIGGQGRVAPAAAPNRERGRRRSPRGKRG